MLGSELFDIFGASAMGWQFVCRRTIEGLRVLNRQLLSLQGRLKARKAPS
jgi:hypothetical protein